jgi:putative PIN family toxin of toxin-antitoxin system
VLVSARFWNGNELEVLRLCQAGHLASVTSPGILDELAGVLASKFDEPLDEIEIYRDEIELVSEVVHPSGRLDVLHEDPSDNMVLETALVGEADLIVSGDGHLLSQGTFQGIRILRAADLVRVIASR